MVKTNETTMEGARLFNRLYASESAADGFRYATLDMDFRMVRISYPMTEEARTKSLDIIRRLPVYQRSEMPEGEWLDGGHFRYSPLEVKIIREFMEQWGLVNCRLTRSNGNALAYVGFLRILIQFQP